VRVEDETVRLTQKLIGVLFEKGRSTITVQNKLHFAIHGQTAAELIVQRADHKKERMGLTTWKNAPDGKIIKTAARR